MNQQQSKGVKRHSASMVLIARTCQNTTGHWFELVMRKLMMILMIVVLSARPLLA